MIDHVLRFIIPAAYAVLPEQMASQPATAFLLTVGLQESKFLERRQIVKGGKPGPAAGLWQFEKGTVQSRGGITGVLLHPATRGPLATALTELRYARAIGDAAALHAIVEHNDVVACVFARLLLWTVPDRVPRRDEHAAAYSQYLTAWNPGKPHPDTWNPYYVEAWHRVDQLDQHLEQQS
jgi:hypothetical protein